MKFQKIIAPTGLTLLTTTLTMRTSSTPTAPPTVTPKPKLMAETQQVAEGTA